MSDATQVRVAVQRMRKIWPVSPVVGIILGTGLGRFVDRVSTEVTMDYAQIPHFPRATALGHAGRFVCGSVANLPVIAMDGRLHLYEGYSHRQVVMPIRVMQQLGIRVLIASNASGGINPRLASGDVVVVEDHIDLMKGNPLVGSLEPLASPHRPFMPRPYDRQLMAQAVRIGRRAGFEVTPAVYAGMTGPNYETRAEYRFLRAIGADVVGMSTIPEVLAAVQTGIRVLTLSVVTNLCRPDVLARTSGAQVIAAAESTEPQLSVIVSKILEHLGDQSH